MPHVRRDLVSVLQRTLRSQRAVICNFDFFQSVPLVLTPGVSGAVAQDGENGRFLILFFGFSKGCSVSDRMTQTEVIFLLSCCSRAAEGGVCGGGGVGAYEKESFIRHRLRASPSP